MSVRIVVDSACDLGKEKASELGIDFSGNEEVEAAVKKYFNITEDGE